MTSAKCRHYRRPARRQDLVSVTRRQQPGSHQEPEGDTLNEAEVIERAEALPDHYAGRVRPQDLDGMRSMSDGDEWQELLDVLIASLAMIQASVTSSERAELRT